MYALLEQPVLRALAVLDRVRRFWLRRLGSHARWLLRSRAERVAWQALLMASVSLWLALRAPLVLLTLGPILFGVPHLAAEIRYLVVRQGLGQRRGWCIAVSLTLLGVLIAPGQGWAFAVVAFSGLLASGSVARRAAAAGSCGVVWLWARSHGFQADVVFAHAHNWFALIVWWLWARGSRWQLLPALCICVFGSVCILSGATDQLLHASALRAGRLSLDAAELMNGLSPTSDPRWAVRWTICFAFMQSVHYGVWLRSLPEEDRARPGIRSFSSSYQALCVDLGPWLLGATLLLLAAIGCVASYDLAAARSGYLRLALFHGPLEFAVLALLWVERRAPRTAQ